MPKVKIYAKIAPQPKVIRGISAQMARYALRDPLFQLRRPRRVAVNVTARMCNLFIPQTIPDRIETHKYCSSLGQKMNMQVNPDISGAHALTERPHFPHNSLCLAPAFLARKSRLPQFGHCMSSPSSLVSSELKRLT